MCRWSAKADAPEAEPFASNDDERHCLAQIGAAALEHGAQLMRLLMFREGGATHLGVGRDSAADEIVDVTAASNGSRPATIFEVIDAGADGLERLRILASSAPASAIRNLADLNLL